jgi:hypothetical protein
VKSGGTLLATFVGMTLRTEELKNRVAAKQKQLQARLAELKADGAKTVADERDRIQAKLAELDQTMRDGWESVTDTAAKKISEWLDRN